MLYRHRLLPLRHQHPKNADHCKAGNVKIICKQYHAELVQNMSSVYFLVANQSSIFPPHFFYSTAEIVVLEIYNFPSSALLF